MKLLPLLLLLAGCASDLFEYPDCAQVTLRAGETCEIHVYYQPRGL